MKKSLFMEKEREKELHMSIKPDFESLIGPLK
jgi:hypothetical protein